MTGPLVEGVRVRTPQGIGKVAAVREWTRWSFGRLHRGHHVTVDYGDGRRHVWPPERLTVLDEAPT